MKHPNVSTEAQTNDQSCAIPNEIFGTVVLFGDRTCGVAQSSGSATQTVLEVYIVLQSHSLHQKIWF